MSYFTFRTTLQTLLTRSFSFLLPALHTRYSPRHTKPPTGPLATLLPLLGKRDGHKVGSFWLRTAKMACFIHLARLSPVEFWILRRSSTNQTTADNIAHTKSLPVEREQAHMVGQTCHFSPFRNLALFTPAHRPLPVVLRGIRRRPRDRTVMAHRSSPFGPVCDHSVTRYSTKYALMYLSSRGFSAHFPCSTTM